ncbi:VOC family protein [Enterovibrio calviensis]|uniref:VOC family protein n=1 Tax=Enterovibrio calviensis TaxID=91359 RepID=UPI000484A5CC|nr:VOC family protein [Enterovibrio calviensis]
MNPVGWFEITVSDLDRATAFYEKTLGITLTRHEMDGIQMAWFPVEQGNNYGATGTLILSDNYIAGTSSTMVYFNVDSIDEVLARVDASAILQPKTNIGDAGKYAHIEDSEGNRVGIHCH